MIYAHNEIVRWRCPDEQQTLICSSGGSCWLEMYVQKVSLEDIAEVLGENKSTKGEILRTKYTEGENFGKAYRSRRNHSKEGSA